MDLAEAISRKEVVGQAPGTEDVKVSDEEKAQIVNDLLTKGVYIETVEIPNLGITVTFRTRTTLEEKTVKERIDKEGIPQLLPDFYFKLGLYSLVYSLVDLNGNPVTTAKDFDERLNELSSKIPAPLVGKIIEEFFKFERKVLLAIDPDFLERASKSFQGSGQGQS